LRQKRSPDWKQNIDGLKDTVTGAKNKLKDRLNQHKNKESNNESNTPESSNGGTKLLDDEEYDAFFAPKFDDFAKWYLAEVKKRKDEKFEKSFIDSLQGLDRNYYFDLVLPFHAGYFHQVFRISKKLGQS